MTQIEYTEDNLLLKCDNLIGLQAIKNSYHGKVKCIYIDPPYNTEQKFNCYDDRYKDWISFIKERLIILRQLLSSDGTIWISIDDKECHYLKILCDEIFGRENFISNVIWERKVISENTCKYISNVHDHILVYAKNKENWKANLMPRTEDKNENYKNPDNDIRGPWVGTPLSRAGVLTQKNQLYFNIESPTYKKVYPKKGELWNHSFETIQELIKDNRIWFGKDGNSYPAKKCFLSEVQQGMVPKSLWFMTECGQNSDAKNEIKNICKEFVFDTPKPEKLLKKIIHIASNPGDLVLDCFGGSGTTGVVAHKMGRRWIMMEMGDHCHTIIIPRLNKVIDGSDQVGISRHVQWKGGGSYKYIVL